MKHEFSAEIFEIFTGISGYVIHCGRGEREKERERGDAGYYDSNKRNSQVC